MTTEQTTFIASMTEAARAGEHIWPEYAACEVALESAFGHSQLFRLANNAFGTKAHASTPRDHILSMPTQEWIAVPPRLITEMAFWVRYDTVADCFVDRMVTLRRLAFTYPHYAKALAAATGEEFVTEVSKTWSTDPARGAKVLEIYHLSRSLLEAHS